MTMRAHLIRYRLQFFAVICCALPVAAAAQDAQDHASVWVAAGVGAGVPTSGGDGIANVAQVVLQKRSHHVALRGVVLHDIESNTKEIGEIGVLYGRKNAFGWRDAVVAVGVSGVAFDTCPDDDDSCFTPALPIVAEVSRRRGVIGLGIQAFANVNRKASYAGVALLLEVGRLPRT